MFANDPKQRRVGIGVNARGFVIDRKGNRRHETSPSFGARADMALFLLVHASINGRGFFVRISDGSRYP